MPDARLDSRQASPLPPAGADLLLFHSPVSILNVLHLVPLRQVTFRFTSSETTVRVAAREVAAVDAPPLATSKNHASILQMNAAPTARPGLGPGTYRRE